MAVSKTRKAFVVGSPHAAAGKGRSVEYNGARVRPSCANDTVSRSSRCRIVPANSFMPPPSPPSFSPHCKAWYVFAFARTRLSVSLDFLVISARSSGIIAVPRLSERSVDESHRGSIRFTLCRELIKFFAIGHKIKSLPIISFLTNVLCKKKIDLAIKCKTCRNSMRNGK